MAIAPPHSCLHDDDVDDAGLEKGMKALRARVAALQDEDVVLPAETWDWAEGVEAQAQWAAERMAQEEEAIQRALSSSSSHMPREVEVEALRAEARRVGALRADAEEIAAATRRLMETDLRRLAADAETGNYNYILILTQEELALASQPQMGDMAVCMEEWMASLAARLNRGAAEFATRPEEEAFVAAMRREAAKAEDARSAIARYRAGGGSLPSPAPGDQMEQDKLPPAQAIHPPSI